MNDTQQPADPGLITIPCPACSVPSRSIKRYGVINRLIFLLLGYQIQHGRYTACPKCMRKKLLQVTFSPRNIFCANLMWLLAILPYHFCLLLVSLIPGHSKGVRKMLGMT